MSRRSLRRHLDDLVAGRRPRPFRATAEDAEELRVAIELRAARPGAGELREGFVDELQRRLAAELAGAEPVTRTPRHRKPRHRNPRHRNPPRRNARPRTPWYPRPSSRPSGRSPAAACSCRAPGSPPPPRRSARRSARRSTTG